MVRLVRWHCPPDTGFEMRALAVWGRARYLSVTEAPHNTEFYERMEKKHCCFFQTAETGVKGSGASHYPGPPPTLSWVKSGSIREYRPSSATLSTGHSMNGRSWKWACRETVSCRQEFHLHLSSAISCDVSPCVPHTLDDTAVQNQNTVASHFRLSSYCLLILQSSIYSEFDNVILS